jgi:hypothetical protein
MSKITIFLLMLSAGLSAQTFTFPQSVSAAPVGADESIQYNNSGSVGAVSNGSTNDTCLVLIDQSTNPSAQAGKVAIFAKDIGSTGDLSFTFQTGTKTTQTDSRFIDFRAFGAALTTVSQQGTNFSTFGTAVGQNMAAASKVEAIKKIGYRTAASVGAFAGVRMTSPGFSAGSSSSPVWGGFYMNLGFQQATTASTGHTFCGMSAITSNPSGSTTLAATLNCVGVGFSTGDTNLSLVYNDGSGSANIVTLGSGFSVSDWFYLELFCAPGASSISYRVTNFTSGSVATGSISEFPSNSVVIGPVVYTHNGSTSTQTTVTLSHIYAETDY